MKNKCCICGKEIEDKWGHNAEPVMVGKCCDVCNIIEVIPARFKLLSKQENETQKIIK